MNEPGFWNVWPATCGPDEMTCPCFLVYLVVCLSCPARVCIDDLVTWVWEWVPWRRPAGKRMNAMPCLCLSARVPGCVYCHRSLAPPHCRAWASITSLHVTSRRFYFRLNQASAWRRDNRQEQQQQQEQQAKSSQVRSSSQVKGAFLVTRFVLVFIRTPSRSHALPARLPAWLPVVPCRTAHHPTLSLSVPITIPSMRVYIVYQRKTRHPSIHPSIQSPPV